MVIVVSTGFSLDQLIHTNKPAVLTGGFSIPHSRDQLLEIVRDWRLVLLTSMTGVFGAFNRSLVNLEVNQEKQIVIAHSPVGTFNLPFYEELGAENAVDRYLGLTDDFVIGPGEKRYLRTGEKNSFFKIFGQYLDDEVRYGANSCSFFFSDKDYITNLHIDYNPNMIHQVHGRKLFYLFPPGDEWRMHPEGHPLERRAIHGGLISPEMLQGLEYSEVILHPGQTIFIPPRWLHYVHTLDDHTVSVVCPLDE